MLKRALLLAIVTVIATQAAYGQEPVPCGAILDSIVDAFEQDGQPLPEALQQRIAQCAAEQEQREQEQREQEQREQEQ
ncbi:MAG: hypothetical protein VCE12_20515, partial [Candidatus Latescibacterota bacterium]